MQTALEQEAKGKAEALRMKKKLEADVAELEMSLEHANAANQETQKTIKNYHQQIRSAQARLEDEQRTKEVCRDQLIASERRAHSVQNALEEARTSRPIAPGGRLNRSCPTPTSSCRTSPAPTRPLLEPRGSWNLRSKPFT